MIEWGAIHKGMPMFSLNDKVVYPGHGVAKINRIIEKVVAGKVECFFELAFLNKDMTILVPTSNLNTAGVRPLSSAQGIETIFALLNEPARISQDPSTSNWNKRNKEYQCKLRTGDLQEICKIYRDLKTIAKQKELSFGEKNLLNQTETLLVEEISLVKEVGEEQTTKYLRSFFNQSMDSSSSRMI